MYERTTMYSVVHLPYLINIPAPCLHLAVRILYLKCLWDGQLQMRVILPCAGWICCQSFSVDYIAFGVEADGAYSDDGTNTDAASYDSTDLDDISKALLQTSDILSNEPDDYKELLAKNLSQGQSYPAARINALKEYTSSECSYISSPNNILALEYLIAIKKSGFNSETCFHSILRFGSARIGSDYNDINTAE
jgi:Predicted nucleotidyltransferase